MADFDYDPDDYMQDEEEEEDEWQTLRENAYYTAEDDVTKNPANAFEEFQN